MAVVSIEHVPAPAPAPAHLTWRSPATGHEPSWTRPALSGWWHASDAVLPKPLPLIVGLDVEGALTGSDLVLFDLLVASAWHDIGAGKTGAFDCRVADVQRVRGVRGRDHRQLLTSLARLQHVSVTLPLLPQTLHGQAPRTPLLIAYRLDAGSRILTWSPAPAVLAALQKVTHYAKLQIGTLVKLRQRPAVLLYEILASRAAMRSKKIKLSAAQLHAFLGTTSKYPRWSSLERQVIKPALQRIEDYTSWQLRLEVRHEPYSRANVVEVQFSIAK